MKWVKALALVVLFVGGTAFAQGTGAYWFSLSSDDPTPVICYPDTLYPGDVFTLHAWLSAESDWGWIGGFTFPIVYNADYIDVYKCVEGSGDSMTIDLNNLGPYMFKGIRFPCDTIASSPPGQAMWYAAVCFSGCPLTTDGTPHHIGSITFEVIDSIPPQCTTIIDTGMYPPSNYATMGDPGGTAGLSGSPSEPLDLSHPLVRLRTVPLTASSSPLLVPIPSGQPLPLPMVLQRRARLTFPFTMLPAVSLRHLSVA